MHYTTPHTERKLVNAMNAHSTGRKTKFAAAVLALTFGTSALAACGSEEAPAPTTEVTQTAPATPDKQAVPEPEVPLTWPLTGIGVEKAENRPAVAVKIENTAAARPQYGLDKADVVWETIVEFEVSRYIAVYHSDYPTEVGPVRSVRPMDIPAVAPLNGLFVYSGGQPGILKLLRAESQMQSLDENQVSAMWRSNVRSAPHNLHANIEKFAAMADDKHSDSPAEQFAFAETAEEASAVSDGTAATSIKLSMSSAAKPQWTWDSKDNAWLRSEGSVPATVSTGDQISATNVVLVTARHYDSGYDAQNNAPVPTYELEGEGKAVVATGGKTLNVTWTKKDAQSPLTLVNEAGETVTLAPGNTWVELMPKGTSSADIS